MSDDHNVFISWSGIRSRWVADAIREWLPVVLQSVKPWMSPEIDKGTRGQNVISDKLNKVKVGIVCLTPENLKEPWILFEAGPLSKAVDKQSYVCTYLLAGLTPTDVEPPLSAFQHTSPDKQDTLRLLSTINAALGVDPVPSAILERAFYGLWPDFEKQLKAMPTAGEAAIVKRPTEDLVSEVLEIARAQADTVKGMQAQIRHVEETLNRAPFGDSMMALSNFITATTSFNASGSSPFMEEAVRAAMGSRLGTQPQGTSIEVKPLFVGDIKIDKNLDET
jgi:hypothetical protein